MGRPQRFSIDVIICCRGWRAVNAGSYIVTLATVRRLFVLSIVSRRGSEWIVVVRRQKRKLGFATRRP
jgi:hypothetical protein